MSPSGTVRVRLRYADLETFIQRFAPNVTRGGIFLASRSPLPVGTEFPFEVQLADGTGALAGDGKVIWVKEFDAAQPQKPHGMGVQFVAMSGPSRAVLARILEAKASGKMPPPHPADENFRSTRNGTGPAVPIAARVDTNVDLAAEYGLDEAALRRAADRTWAATSGNVQALDDLLKPEPVETVTLAQALAELPRMLDPAARRRSGVYRNLEITSTGERSGDSRPNPIAPVPVPVPVRTTETADSRPTEAVPALLADET